MKLHGNAALSLNKRRFSFHRVVDHDWSLTKAAEAAGVNVPTARKWIARYLAEGEAGLFDRPSAAHHVHDRTPETASACSAPCGCVASYVRSSKTPPSDQGRG